MSWCGSVAWRVSPHHYPIGSSDANRRTLSWLAHAAASSWGGARQVAERRNSKWPDGAVPRRACWRGYLKWARRQMSNGTLKGEAARKDGTWVEDDKRETCRSVETTAACVMLYGGQRQRTERARAATMVDGAWAGTRGVGWGGRCSFSALTLSRGQDGPQHDGKTDTLALGRTV